jgi:hypothetical protein
MNNIKFDIQKALSDIALIRRTLNQTDQDQMDRRLTGVTLDANFLLQVIAFLSVLALFIIEIVSGNSIMQTLMSAGQVDELRRFGIGLMGFILVGLLTTLYFVLWRAAVHNGEEVRSYITRNFNYVKNLSMISDLMMKFITISLLLLAGKAEWIAPVLMAFTGDYLLQGRFFTIPMKTSAVLGIGCLATAFAQFTSDIHTLLLPLGVFSLISVISLSNLAKRYQQQKSLATQ